MLAREAMLSGICHFEYEKNNGEMREAYGTLSSEVIEAITGKGKTAMSKKGTGTTSMPYFDLQKGEWRAFRKDRIKAVDTDYVI